MAKKARKIPNDVYEAEIFRLQTELVIREPADLDAAVLADVADGLARLSDRLATAYFS